MNYKLPKKFKILINVTVIAIFIGYALLTSEVEIVQGNTIYNNNNIVQNIIPYETYEQVNNNLDFGEKRIIQNGINGLSVDVNGTNIVLQQPQPQIVEIGEKILYTFTGSLTGYTPYCDGCSGRVGAGQDVRGGNIYYNDAKYGKLRIVAADPKFPYGTILRLRNLNISEEPILAIVLDRGGAVKGNLIDLLFASNEDAPPGVTQSNITVDVIREGY